jgi:L-glyceraldehyde 3-phosphate reductase
MTSNATCVAFDHGITHFDLANTTAPPSGSAEEAFARFCPPISRGYRDELISSAGYDMWAGPHEWQL